MDGQININAKALARAMIQEALNENKKLDLRIIFAEKNYPEFFTYLAGSERLSEKYHANFHNEELATWILNQPDSSIAPHKLFAKAVSLADGDVLKGTVFIHETLGNYARTKTNYVETSYTLKDRDHYGSWHRIWILMANQMATRSPNRVNNGYRLLKNSLVSVLAEAVKLMTQNFYFGDKRKIILNQKGAVVGYHLTNNIQNQLNGPIERYTPKTSDYLTRKTPVKQTRVRCLKKVLLSLIK